MIIEISSKQISVGIRVSGFVCSIYAAINIIRYVLFGQIAPLFFPNSPPMPFSSAVLFLLNGMSIFWISYLVSSPYVKDVVKREEKQKQGMTPDQWFKILSAIISLLAILATGLVAILNKK